VFLVVCVCKICHQLERLYYVRYLEKQHTLMPYYRSEVVPTRMSLNKGFSHDLMLASSVDFKNQWRYTSIPRCMPS
jgi:hypothetical protein